jgi:hypothetical protein
MAPRRRAAAGAAVVLLIGALALPIGADAAAPPPDTVTVEVLVDQPAGAGAPIPTDVLDELRAVGGSVVGADSGSVVLVDVPAAAVDDLQAAGVDVREPVHVNVPLSTAERAVQYGNVPGDSAAVIGANDWQQAGYDGTGVRIGVIDYFKMSVWNPTEMGPAPTVANGHAMCRVEGTDCGATFTSDDSGRHGPAVVEVIRDVAPGADVYVAQAETYSDYVQVIDWFAANHVTIVNRSLGSYMDGPGDGTGPMDELADYAAGKGMIWLNAAGNEAAGGYWRGTGQLTAGNYVKFNDVAGDTMAISNCTVAGLRWNDWTTPAGSRADYDLQLWRGTTTPTTMVSSATESADGSPLEQLPPTCPPMGTRFFLRIKYLGGGMPSADTLEILDYEGGLGISQAPYSATIPAADSANPSVLAVGAVDPVGGTNIGYYSSQGPTNDGRIKPDIVAPSGVRSSIYPTGFRGTSASAPAAAGMAALLLQSGLTAPGAPLAALVRSSVTPLGSPVPNNTYGAGVVHLPAVPAAPPPPVTTAYEPLPEPQRVLDTRSTSPIGPSSLIGQRSPGTVLEVPVEALLGRAAGSLAAVALNLTVVEAPTTGWAQVIPTNRAALGAYSNLNIDAAGQTRSNVVLVPVGDNGSISVYLGAGGSVLIDVLGTYSPEVGEATAGRLIPVDPARVLDTRPTSRVGASGTGPGGSLQPGGAVCIDPTAAGIPSDASVAALVLNVTATDVQQGGFVQTLPTGGTAGTTSTLNLVAGGTTSNTTIAPLGGPCGVATHSVSVLLGSGSAKASAHLVVDVTGYITGSTAAASTVGLFVPITPGRVLDTRPEPLPTSQTLTVAVAGAAGPTPAVPVGASGVAVNLTATGTRGWGYLSAWPAGGPLPATSSLNWSSAGATVANGAILKLSANGGLALRSTTPTSATSADHLLDVFGYYT